MKTIEYRIQYTGAIKEFGSSGYWADDGAEYEHVRVQARDINSGYRKALKRALEPLGNGNRREIGAIEFSQVVF
jgi:hypothetical protein